MVLKSGVLEHRHGVSAHEEHFTFLDFVMGVQHEDSWRCFDCTFVSDGLTVVFAVWLEVIKLEESVSGRDELYTVAFCLKSLVLDSDFRILDESWIRESTFLRQSFEVVPIESAGKAFTKEYRILCECSWDPLAGIDIREVELTARLENSVSFPEDGLFIHSEIDHTI